MVAAQPQPHVSRPARGGPRVVLLWCHVQHGTISTVPPGGRTPRGLPQLPADAKVRQHWAAIIRQQHVGRLDVQHGDAGGVKLAQPRQDAAAVAEMNRQACQRTACIPYYSASCGCSVQGMIHLSREAAARNTKVTCCACCISCGGSTLPHAATQRHVLPHAVSAAAAMTSIGTPMI